MDIRLEINTDLFIPLESTIYDLGAQLQKCTDWHLYIENSKLRGVKDTHEILIGRCKLKHIKNGYFVEETITGKEFCIFSKELMTFLTSEPKTYLPLTSEYSHSEDEENSEEYEDNKPYPSSPIFAPYPEIESSLYEDDSDQGKNFIEISIPRFENNSSSEEIKRMNMKDFEESIKKIYGVSEYTEQEIIEGDAYCKYVDSDSEEYEDNGYWEYTDNGYWKYADNEKWEYVGYYADKDEIESEEYPLEESLELEEEDQESLEPEEEDQESLEPEEEDQESLEPEEEDQESLELEEEDQESLESLEKHIAYFRIFIRDNDDIESQNVLPLNMKTFKILEDENSMDLSKTITFSFYSFLEDKGYKSNVNITFYDNIYAEVEIVSETVIPSEILEKIENEACLNLDYSDVLFFKLRYIENNSNIVSNNFMYEYTDHVYDYEVPISRIPNGMTSNIPFLVSKIPLKGDIYNFIYKSDEFTIKNEGQGFYSIFDLSNSLKLPHLDPNLYYNSYEYNELPIAQFYFP